MFARALRKIGLFNPLLFAYAETGDPAYVAKWSAYVDDWCLHQQDDAGRSPHNIQTYHPNQIQIATAFVDLLATLQDLRPEFKSQLPPGTFVRALLRVLEESSATTARQHHFFPSNWRDLQAQNLLRLGLAFRELRLSNFMLREGRRLLEISGTVSLYPDGTGLELTPNYNWMYLGWGTGPISKMLKANPQPWASPQWFAELHDNAMSRARFLSHAVMSTGQELPIGPRDNRNVAGQYVNEEASPSLPHDIPEILAEPEVAKVISTIFGDGRHGTPSFASEWFPYTGYYVFREGWKADDQFAFMICSPIVDVGGPFPEWWENNNAFSLFGFGEELVFDHYETPVTVDGQPQNSRVGMPFNAHSGWVARRPTHPRPADGRWHTSRHFDYAEGMYEGPYGSLGKHVRDHLLGQKANPDDYITDVSHERRVIFVRQHGLWIIADRMESTEEHEYAQKWMFHVPEKDPYGPVYGFAPEQIDIDDDGQSIQTHNPAGPNVSLYHVGTADVRYESLLAPPNPQGIDTWTTAGRDPKHIEPYNYVEAFTISRVNAVWKGRGDQLLLTILYPRKSDADGLSSYEPFRGSGVLGCDIVLTDGAQVMFRSAVDEGRPLESSGLEGVMEALLVVRASDGTTHGMVLGGKSVSYEGQALAAAPSDFEFQATGRRLHVTTPIHRPIDPVDIQPDIDVFTDSVEVTMSSATPSIEIRYTLDGADPTPSSLLYTGPVALTDRATVKARALRPGLEAVPPIMSGTEASAVSRAVFTREQPRAAVNEARLVPGLDYTYYEAEWMRLFVALETCRPVAQGHVRALLDMSNRQGKAPFAFKYAGFIEVPEAGVYTIHAPDEFAWPYIDPGYDLQVYIAGQEWYPSTRRHAFGTWSVALEQGHHTFSVSYADFRDAKPDFYHPYREYGVVWEGEKPALEVSGPAPIRQPIPSAWLWRRADTP